MNEDFLKFVWKFGLLSPIPHFTVCGKKLQIIQPGIENMDAGPDFSNARIYIDDTLWAGNVEIHVKSSDWLKHQHNQNPSFNSVILHVVYHYDSPVSRINGDEIPALELKPYIIPEVHKKYRDLDQNKTWVPCASYLKTLNKEIIPFWLERLAIQRLERKASDIGALVDYYNSDWEQAFFIILGRAFGFRVNSQAFEALNKSIAFNILLRYQDDISQLEALLFGQSGLLDLQPNDPYVIFLQKEYKHLQTKHNLKPIEHYHWKLLRLRPVNFPTLRISQLAVLIHNKGRLFDAVLNCDNTDNLFEMFRAQATPYWNSHYVFGKTSSFKQKLLGNEAILSVLINTVIPFLFVYGKARDLPDIQERAIDFLSQLPAEHNTITNHWFEHGIFSKDALQSQALLQLKSQYCDAKKCLNCQIGTKILSPS